MFAKIATIALMAFIATSQGDDVWTGFSARWDQDVTNGFRDLPQTVKAAKSEGWTEISGVAASNDIVGLGYFGDPLYVILFSKKTGRVFGVQVALKVEDIENAEVPVNYADNPGFITKTLNGEEYYTATAFFHQDEKAGTRKLWFQNEDGIVEIPTKSDSVLRLTEYVWSPCFERTGVHYVLIDSNGDCSKIYPWLLMIVDDDVVGLEFLAVGNTTAAPTHTWFEFVPSAAYAIRTLIPTAPSCLGEYLMEYGYSFLHTWFVKNPENITCPTTMTSVFQSDIA